MSGAEPPAVAKNKKEDKLGEKLIYPLIILYNTSFQLSMCIVRQF